MPTSAVLVVVEQTGTQYAVPQPLADIILFLAQHADLYNDRRLVGSSTFILHAKEGNLLPKSELVIAPPPAN